MLDRSYPWASLWLWAGLLLAGLFLAPVLVVLASVFDPQPEVWQHLISTVLPEYVVNTLILTVGVGVGTVGAGIATAWLVGVCDWPGRGFWEWALVLPFAAPAYVLAFAYAELLEVFGPVQVFLRQITGWQVGQYWFPNVRSLPGAILMFVCVLYPYVYLLARVSFRQQSRTLLEASQLLGWGKWGTFLRVALPLARPAVMAGLALALMETLADFGVVDYFGVPVFTTGIYRTWFNLGSRVAATQLAVCLLVLVLGLVVLELYSRRQARYTQTKGGMAVRLRLRGSSVIWAWLACGLPVLIGFVVPGGVLLEMAVRYRTETFDASFWEAVGHTCILAAVSAGLALLIALFLSYGTRLFPGGALPWLARLVAMGYAVPGAVIAVGVLLTLGWVDQTLGRLVVGGTVVAVIFAYLVRYLALALGSVEAGLTRIAPELDEAARSLGHPPWSTLVRVHVPLLAGTLVSAGILVFVDVVKELPATLIIRPFNFDTLAIRVYRYTQDARIIEASGLALALVVVGMIPVLILCRQIAQESD
ncbi:binding-protein-dependent transporters inner membrane component [Gloeomargarita lithophora Alchichica-D10]|uniref:Binding-protein-dependent transporters inner membrane component n=1 Tax=Gloeomargarita lithophora Alchichica-D10 TaxID=1188229 RepID=A0A1J0AAZ5_9CYAN|nr:iron ABC transporter permease [Gloeomargarita lithophora]APB33108.1 binding-protein-dependent transporters inner membrane component [Gloeomargarita lithophora Alchichica-D10]